MHLLIFWGRSLLFDSQTSFPGRNCRVLARSPGEVICPDCFCSQKAFCAALEDKDENGGLPEPKAWGSTPQCTPREKQPLLSPWSLSTLCGQPVTECFNISHVIPFRVSKPCRLLSCACLPLLPREGTNHLTTVVGSSWQL